MNSPNINIKNKLLKSVWTNQTEIPAGTANVQQKPAFNVYSDAAQTNPIMNFNFNSGTPIITPTAGFSQYLYRFPYSATGGQAGEPLLTIAYSFYVYGAIALIGFLIFLVAVFFFRRRR